MSFFLPSLLSPPAAPAATENTPPPFILITDSILQPGLLLLREFISSSLERGEHVVLLALEQSPSRLIPASHDTSKLDLINAVSSSPVASTSTLPPSALDITAPGGVQAVERKVLEVIGRRKRGDKVLLVLDSVDALAEHGVQAVFSLVHKALKALERLPGSRLLALHHHAFPSPPSTLLSASLLPTLLSPTISPSTIHLTLHPSPLLELLSREYGLSIPLTPHATLDLRLTSFLTSFASRSWGDPFLRPTNSEMEDERVPLDLGGGSEGACVVEWSARGVAVPGKRGETKKFLARGVEGLRRVGGRVEGVGLREVLRPERMLAMAIPTPDMAAATASSKVVEPLLPFNLSLTDAQKAAREEVVLPYLPKEEGQGGGIEYAPDAGDDMDDDDPDEDLEL